MNSGSVNKRAKGWPPPRRCGGMRAAGEGTGLRGWVVLGGGAPHPVPSLWDLLASRATLGHLAQVARMSPGQEESKRQAGGIGGVHAAPHLAQQWWRFGNAIPLQLCKPEPEGPQILSTTPMWSR